MTEVVIDGSVYEGGGQSVRIAVGLSVILNKTCRIINIRAGRPKPGLSNQHLAGVLLVRDISQASITDENEDPVAIGCQTMIVTPQNEKLTESVYDADAKTAGSIGLIAQIALPIVVYKGSGKVKLEIKGGTDAEFAPPVRIQNRVFTNLLKEFGVTINVVEKRNGFFPIGKGATTYEVSPVSKSNGFVQNQSQNLKFHAEIWYSVDQKTKSRENKIRSTLNEASEIIKSFEHESLGQIKVDVKKESLPGIGVACGVYAYGTVDDKVLLSHTVLGKFNRKGQLISSGDELAKSVLDDIRENVESKPYLCLDRHHSDQILIYAALSHGTTIFNVSNEKGKIPSHVLTAIYVIESFLGKIFEWKETNTLTVNGVGFKNSNFSSK